MASSLVPVVKALVILDGDGHRLCSKYYAKGEFPTDAEQVRKQLTRNGADGKKEVVWRTTARPCRQHEGSNANLFIEW